MLRQGFLGKKTKFKLGLEGWRGNLENEETEHTDIPQGASLCADSVLSFYLSRPVILFNEEAQWDSATRFGIEVERQGRWGGCE